MMIPTWAIFHISSMGRVAISSFSTILYVYNIALEMTAALSCGEVFEST